MALVLYMHPLSTFCQKVLVALYENEIPFEKHILEFGNQASREEFLKIWPLGKFPVLRDESKGHTIPESTLIIEYLARNYPAKIQLLPSEPDLAMQVRLWDRLYDLYVQEPMQKIVLDRLRPAGKQDPYGVEQAKASLHTSYELIDRAMASKLWAVGKEFTMADCAAAPALFYANQVLPFGDSYRNVAAYLQRLMERPSYARAHREAQPYFKNFPRAAPDSSGATS